MKLLIILVLMFYSALSLKATRDSFIDGEKELKVIAVIFTTLTFAALFGYAIQIELI